MSEIYSFLLLVFSFFLGVLIGYSSFDKIVRAFSFDEVSGFVLTILIFFIGILVGHFAIGK